MFTYVYVFSTYPDFAFLSLGLSATDRRALLSPPGSHSTAPCCHGLFGWEAPWWLPQNLVQSCQMAKSIVDGFRRELLMLLNDLCGSEMLREGKEKDGEIFRGPK